MNEGHLDPSDLGCDDTSRRKVIVDFNGPVVGVREKWRKIPWYGRGRPSLMFKLCFTLCVIGRSGIPAETPLAGWVSERG